MLALTATRLSDSFARAGYATIAPDLFDGQPAPADLNDPNFDAGKFIAEHGPEVTDPKIEKAIKYVQENYESYKIAATGYCFGGRYSFRFASEGRGIDAAFAAHPSGLETEEVESVVKPLSLASAGESILSPRVASAIINPIPPEETDELFPAEQRREVEDLLLATQEPYQTSLYSGTFHGFGTRANISDPEQKFAKETAFYQAVIWFNSWA